MIANESNIQRICNQLVSFLEAICRMQLEKAQNIARSSDSHCSLYTEITEMAKQKLRAQQKVQQLRRHIQRVWKQRLELITNLIYREQTGRNEILAIINKIHDIGRTQLKRTIQQSQNQENISYELLVMNKTIEAIDKYHVNKAAEQQLMEGITQEFQETLAVLKRINEQILNLNLPIDLKNIKQLNNVLQASRLFEQNFRVFMNHQKVCLETQETLTVLKRINEQILNLNLPIDLQNIQQSNNVLSASSLFEQNFMAFMNHHKAAEKQLMERITQEFQETLKTLTVLKRINEQILNLNFNLNVPIDLKNIKQQRNVLSASSLFEQNFKAFMNHHKAAEKQLMERITQEFQETLKTLTILKRINEQFLNLNFNLNLPIDLKNIKQQRNVLSASSLFESNFRAVMNHQKVCLETCSMDDSVHSAHSEQSYQDYEKILQEKSKSKLIKIIIDRVKRSQLKQKNLSIKQENQKKMLKQLEENLQHEKKQLEKLRAEIKPSMLKKDLSSEIISTCESERCRLTK